MFTKNLEDARMRKPLKTAVIYLSAFTLLFSQAMPVHAGIISTEQLMNQQLVEADQKTLLNLLDREDVRILLEKKGVTTEQAQERINHMTDQEIRTLAQKFEEQPAPGSIGVAAAVLILILVFIALELAGKTDVFTGI